MTPDAILLFAAGFGTRMRPLTDTVPKPLIKVAGKPLLDHTLDLCTSCSRIVVNTHYRHDQIAEHLTDHPVILSHETPDILETGGGLRHARTLLGDGPVFTMNTDAVWAGPNPLDVLRDAWNPNKMEALLLCVPLPQTRGRKAPGDFSLSSQGQLIRGGNLVYSGTQIIEPNGLHEVKEKSFSLNVLWNKMAERGTLYGVTYPGLWCDVGHPGGIAIAEDLLSNV